MHPRRLVRDSIGFTATQYLVRAALMVRGIVAMRMLGPATYGVWTALMLLLEYGSLAPLGTQQGLDQAVPGRIVTAESKALDRIKRAGLFNILLFTALFAFAALYVLLRSHGQLMSAWGVAGILLAVLCVALVNVSNYYLTILRSHGDIPSVSTWFVLQGAIGTAVGLALIPVLGVWGLLVGWVGASAIGLAYVYVRGRHLVPLTPAPSSDSRLLLQVGLPMFLYSASTLVMRSLDRLIILRFLGTEMLGYYSLAIIVLGFLLYLPDSLAYVIYPHFLRRYQESGMRPEAIRDLVSRALRLVSVMVPGLCGLAFIVARQGAVLFLPHYVPGASAARVMCFAAGAIAVANLSSIVLMTLGRQRLLPPTAAAVTLLGGIADYAVVRAGFGIEGVAWATFGTFTVSGILMPWLALSGLRLSPGERFRTLVELFTPLVTALALAFALDKFLPWATRPGFGIQILRMSIAGALFLVGYFAVCHRLVRGLGLRQLASEFRLLRLGGARPVEATDV